MILCATQIYIYKYVMVYVVIHPYVNPLYSGRSKKLTTSVVFSFSGLLSNLKNILLLSQGFVHTLITTQYNKNNIRSDYFGV